MAETANTTHEGAEIGFNNSNFTSTVAQEMAEVAYSNTHFTSEIQHIGLEIGYYYIAPDKFRARFQMMG